MICERLGRGLRMHDALRSQLTVWGYLRAESGLRVGTGRLSTVSGTDLAVIRDAQGDPFIPGSSLKGALRSYLEARLKGMIPTGADSRHIVACDPNTDEEDGPCLSAEEIRRIKEGNKDDEALTEAIIVNSCLICQTFGSPWLASPVRVRDLSVRAEEWFGQFDVRDGVAIDRDKGTVSEGRLYDYETVPAGTRFEFHLMGDNLADWQLGLLWLGLRALEQGEIAIGGFTRRGLGWISLEEVDARLFTGAQAMLDRLMGEADGQRVEDEEVQTWTKALQVAVRERGTQDA